MCDKKIDFSLLKVNSDKTNNDSNNKDHFNKSDLASIFRGKCLNVESSYKSEYIKEPSTDSPIYMIDYILFM